jgi:hypothetical protein
MRPIRYRDWVKTKNAIHKLRRFAKRLRGRTPKRIKFMEAL